MKFKVSLGLALALTVSVCSARAATVTVNFDENGNGTVTRSGGPTFVMHSFGNIVDFLDPSSGVHPLAYDLSGAGGTVNSAVNGDVWIVEPGLAPTDPNYVQDVLRFEATGAIYVYSDKTDGVDSQADVGIPLSVLNNPQGTPLIITEQGAEGGINGLFGYTPAPGQPGDQSGGPNGNGDVAVYNFTSDAVPEPSQLILAGSVLAAGVVIRKVRRRKAVTA